MKKPLVSVALFAVGALVGTAAHALPITYMSSFYTPNDKARGIAYDPQTGQVIVVERSDNLNWYDPVSGEKKGKKDSDGLILEGLDIMPNGNFLAAQNARDNKRIIELDPNGDLVDGGIDFDVTDKVDENSGLVYNQKTGTIFHVDDNDDTIREFSTLGDEISSLDATQFGMDDIEGIAFNPINGNLIIADDHIGALFEIDMEKEEKVSVYMLPNEAPMLQDALALSVDTQNMRLFVGHGDTKIKDANGGEVEVRVRRVDIFQFEEVPEPGILSLFAFGLLGLSSQLRRQKTAT